MPKSPQPGHQSTWTSVLYCCRTNFLGAAAAASGMGHHDLLLLFGERGPHALDDLIARERPAIVFQDMVVERDAGLLGDQGAKLRRVVVFNQHRQPGTAQDARHRIGGGGVRGTGLPGKSRVGASPPPAPSAPAGAFLRPPA